MKRITGPLLAVVLLFIGCSNGDSKDKGKAKPTITTASTIKDISGATDIRTVLCQDWENAEDAEQAAYSNGSDFEMPYRGLSFFSDGSVVKDPRDAIGFGNWTLEAADKLINITYADGNKARFKIISMSTKKMILMNMEDKQQLQYRADGKTQQQVTDDPFYSSNNQWRKKPTHSESDSAIKLRVLQCVLFYSKFLDDNLARGGTVISFAGLPAIFKWYSGGIAVTRREKLGVKWIACFYNKDEAYKGQLLLEDIISKKYKWNKEETNWVKQDADVIKQIYDTLRMTK